MNLAFDSGEANVHEWVWLCGCWVDCVRVLAMRSEVNNTM